jgi:hypothetical protein
MSFVVLLVLFIFNIKSTVMSSFTITLHTPESEQAFLEFVESHLDIEVFPNEPSLLDANGKFQRINLAADGLPVSPEYLAWRLERSMDSVKISKEDFLVGVEKRKEEFLKK